MILVWSKLWWAIRRWNIYIYIYYIYIYLPQTHTHKKIRITMQGCPWLVVTNKRSLNITLWIGKYSAYSIHFSDTYWEPITFEQNIKHMHIVTPNIQNIIIWIMTPKWLRRKDLLVSQYVICYWASIVPGINQVAELSFLAEPHVFSQLLP